jgi:VanZ family protein
LKASVFLSWLPPAAWAALIFFLSGRPALPGPSIPLADKAFHAVEFGILALLIARPLLAAFPRRRSREGRMGAVVLSLSFAVSDEFHQAFVPGRTCDIFDVAADFAGIVLALSIAGLLAARHFRTNRRRGKRPPQALNY